jgi:DNA-binding IclR family transcriptional regulator
VIGSADRVLKVLEAFTPRDDFLALADLAERLQLPKSSVHRLLATLVAHQLVERDPVNRKYRLGLRLFEIGAMALNGRGLQEAAPNVLHDLSAEAGETCHLAVLSGAEAIYLYKVDGPSSFAMSSRVGRRAPCHATSIGKALVAWASEDLIKQVIWMGLRPYTRHTITNSADLQAELAKVREAGYAIDLEEFEDGLRCIAAPVRDSSGRVVAAVGIAGPSTRVTDEAVPKLVPPVMTAAMKLSRNLGYLERPIEVSA